SCRFLELLRLKGIAYRLLGLAQAPGWSRCCCEVALMKQGATPDVLAKVTIRSSPRPLGNGRYCAKVENSTISKISQKCVYPGRFMAQWRDVALPRDSGQRWARQTLK